MLIKINYLHSVPCRFLVGKGVWPLYISLVQLSDPQSFCFAFVDLHLSCTLAPMHLQWRVQRPGTNCR